MTVRDAIIPAYLGGLKSQIRVIVALFLREGRTRFGNKRLGLLWGVIEPLLHVAIFFLLSLVLGRMGPFSIPYIPFLASGIFPFILMRNCYNRTVNAVSSSRGILVFPQVTLLNISVGYALMEYMKTTAALAVVLFLYSWFVEPIGLDDFPRAFLAYSFFPVIGIALGALMRPLIAVFSFLDAIIPLLMRIIYLTSGVFFSLERIPEQYRSYVFWNPFTQLLEIERDGLFSAFRPHEGMSSWGYILLVTALLFVFGHVLEKRYERFVFSGADD